MVHALLKVDCTEMCVGRTQMCPLETPAAILSQKYHLNYCQDNTPRAFCQRTEGRSQQSSLKAYALKQRAEKRAVFDQVKWVFSYNTNENF